jgi:hypothetical protein
MVHASFKDLYLPSPAIAISTIAVAATVSSTSGVFKSLSCTRGERTSDDVGKATDDVAVLKLALAESFFAATIVLQVTTSFASSPSICRAKS